MLDLTECCLNDFRKDGVDWISRFPPTKTLLESFVFAHILAPPVNFKALEYVLGQLTNLRQLRVNGDVPATQL